MNMMTKQIIEIIKQNQNFQLKRLVNAKSYDEIFVNDFEK